MIYGLRVDDAALCIRFDFGGVRWANRGMLNSFGSLDQRITNMLYTNGELDPFIGNGLSYTFEAGSAAYNIASKMHAI